jgi:hypothetical protein
MKHKNESKGHKSGVPTHRKIIAAGALAGMSLLNACATDGGSSKERSKTTVSTTTHEASTTTEMATTTTMSPAEIANAERDKGIELQSAEIQTVAEQIADSVFAKVDELYAANIDLEGTGIRYSYEEFIPGVQEGSLELRYDDPSKDLLCAVYMDFITTAEGDREPKQIHVACSDFSDIIDDSEWGGSDSMTSVGVIMSNRGDGLPWTLFSSESADVGMDGKEYEKIVSASGFEPLSEEVLKGELDKARFIAAYVANAQA